MCSRSLPILRSGSGGNMSKRLCNIHGLWTKTEKQARCPKCKITSTREYDKKYRNQEASKFYHSREWKRVRGLQLSKYPLCVECNRPAKIVDHIVEIEDGGAKLSLSNLQSMCISCHNAKTTEQKIQRRGRVKSLQTDSLHTEPPTNSQDKPFSGGTL